MGHSVSLPALDIPSLLRKHGLHTRKRLGQNFLIDDQVLEKIVCTADIQPDDIVLEIGAGIGNLTRHLAVHASQVLAVEIDEHILGLLEEVTGELKNVRIIPGDILTLRFNQIFQNVLSPGQSFLVVANIPYYITSAVIRHLLEAPIKPTRIVLTIQREVAQRICAAPGELSLLALSVQVYGKPSIVARIPAGAFYPPPQVDSAVVRIDMYPQPVIETARLDDFFRVARAGFSQKRKTLRNSLSSGLGLPHDKIEDQLAFAGIDPNRRAETLSLPEWERLTLAFYTPR